MGCMIERSLRNANVFCKHRTWIGSLQPRKTPLIGSLRNDDENGYDNATNQ